MTEKEKLDAAIKYLTCEDERKRVDGSLDYLNHEEMFNTVIKAAQAHAASMNGDTCACGVKIEQRLSSGLRPITCESATGYKHNCPLPPPPATEKDEK